MLIKDNRPPNHLMRMQNHFSTHQMVSSGVNANKRNISQIIYPQTIPNSSQRGNVNVSAQYGSSYSAGSGNTDQIFHIMDKQNEITSLLVQQRSLSSLPKREIQVFDGNPLQYHSFMKSFESGVEHKTESPSDRLYFLEQYTRGSSKRDYKKLPAYVCRSWVFKGQSFTTRAFWWSVQNCICLYGKGSLMGKHQKWRSRSFTRLLFVLKKLL